VSGSGSKGRPPMKRQRNAGPGCCARPRKVSRPSARRGRRRSRKWALPANRSGRGRCGKWWPGAAGNRERNWRAPRSLMWGESKGMIWVRGEGRGVVKRYGLEPGAALVDHLFARAARDRLMCLMLGAAEVVAALARKRNGGRITPAVFASALVQLRAEVLD